MVPLGNEYPRYAAPEGKSFGNGTSETRDEDGDEGMGEPKLTFNQKVDVQVDQHMHKTDVHQHLHTGLDETAVAAVVAAADAVANHKVATIQSACGVMVDQQSKIYKTTLNPLPDRY